jgi:hypothetical protein
MTTQEKAKELILLFEPHVYPYLSSGMLTNTYDDDVILMMSKKCALKCVEEIIKELDSYRFNNDVEDESSQEYYKKVKIEIEAMEKLKTEK